MAECDRIDAVMYYPGDRVQQEIKRKAAVIRRRRIHKKRLYVKRRRAVDLLLPGIRHGLKPNT